MHGRTSESTASVIRWQTDRQGVITHWSGSPDDFLGLSAPEAVGRRPEDLPCRDSMGHSPHCGWPLSRRRRFCGRPLVWSTPAGGKVMTINSGSLTFDAEGIFSGYVGTLALWDTELVNFPNHIVPDRQAFCTRLGPLLAFAAATRCGLSVLAMERSGNRELYAVARLLCEDAVLLWEQRERLYAAFACHKDRAVDDLMLQVSSPEAETVVATIVSQNPVHVVQPQAWLHYLDRAFKSRPRPGGIVSIPYRPAVA